MDDFDQLVEILGVHFAKSCDSKDEHSLAVALLTSHRTAKEVKRLTQVLDHRLDQIARENAILGLLLLRVIKLLEKYGPAETEAILSEVRRIAENDGGETKGIAMLTAALNLPLIGRTPILPQPRPSKPLGKPPRPPASQSIATRTKPS